MKIIGNLLILITLIALIFFGIKGIAYLGSKAKPATTALEASGTKVGEFIADAGEIVTEKGKNAVNAIKGGVKSIKDEQLTSETSEESKEDLFKEEEEIDEKAPYEHDEYDDENIEKGNIGDDITDETSTTDADKDLKTASAATLENTEAKAKMALAQKRDKATDASTEKGEAVKKEASTALKKAVNKKKPSDYNQTTAKKKRAAITKPFVVIAGAFSTPAAAKSEVARLKKLGCTNASTFQFPNKKSVAVAAGRYKGRPGAEMMVAKLNDLNIESYIHHQKR